MKSSAAFEQSAIRSAVSTSAIGWVSAAWSTPAEIAIPATMAWSSIARMAWSTTYNGEDRHDGTPTFGGYSERIVVSDRFVLKVPDALDPAAAAPLLCAGITTYFAAEAFWR